MQLPQYEFKWAEETLWLVAVAVGSVLAQAMFSFDPVHIDDWRVWGAALAGACVRAAGGALIAGIAKFAASRRSSEE